MLALGLALLKRKALRGDMLNAGISAEPQSGVRLHHRIRKYILSATCRKSVDEAISVNKTLN